jgi:hypothetical protein
MAMVIFSKKRVVKQNPLIKQHEVPSLWFKTKKDTLL